MKIDLSKTGLSPSELILDLYTAAIIFLELSIYKTNNSKHRCKITFHCEHCKHCKENNTSRIFFSTVLISVAYSVSTLAYRTYSAAATS